MDERRKQPSAELRRQRAAWARGAAEGKALDRLRALRMSPKERMAEGLSLVRIAQKLQAARRVPPPA